jgi:hypothetical protein
MSVVVLRRLSALAVISIGVLIACLPAGRQLLAQAKAPISPKDKPIVLFNGKDLKPFHTWLRDTQHADPRHVFNVAKDQGTPVIHITGDGYGGLVTNDEYTNYHLIAEYRWGELTYADRLNSPRDNGILVHGQGPDGGSLVQVVDGFSPWLTSLEFQIEEGDVGDLFVLGGDKDGKPLDVGATVEVEMRDGPGRGGTRTPRPLWKKGGEPRRFARGAPDGNRASGMYRDLDLVRTKGSRGANDPDTPGLGWTRVEIIADGNTLTHIVNGKTVLQATNVTPTFGRIQIQSEQAEIYYRRIELLPLKKK